MNCFSTVSLIVLARAPITGRSDSDKSFIPRRIDVNFPLFPRNATLVSWSSFSSMHIRICASASDFNLFNSSFINSIIYVWIRSVISFNENFSSPWYFFKSPRIPTIWLLIAADASFDAILSRQLLRSPSAFTRSFSSSAIFHSPFTLQMISF